MDQEQDSVEVHSEEEDLCGIASKISYPGTLDFENIDQMERKGLILCCAKSTEIPFSKSMHGSNFRSFHGTWYNVHVGRDTIHRNWMSY